MTYWKDAFCRSIDPDLVPLSAFEFGPPATEKELAALESAMDARIPEDLRALLCEFNGVTYRQNDYYEPYFLSTSEIPNATEMYREWGVKTKVLIECSQNMMYLCQENGFSEMWGMVIRPFSQFEYGQIIAFDHDYLDEDVTVEELFSSPYSSLVELVETTWKYSRKRT